MFSEVKPKKGTSSVPSVKKRFQKNGFYGRFPKKTKETKAAYVIVQESPESGAVTFSQFSEDTAENSQHCRPIHIVEGPISPARPTTSLGKFSFKTPGGTLMDSKRNIELVTTNDGVEEVRRTLLFLSPVANRSKPRVPAFERTREACDLSLLPIKTDHPSLSAVTNIKGGIVMPVNPEERDRKKLKSQWSVFGMSAKEALWAFIQDKGDSLDPNIRKMMENIVTNHQAEFLHCYAVSLCPEEVDPQQIENLGIGSAEANTSMMVLEVVAKRLAKMDQINANVVSQFLTFPGTQVITEIKQEVAATKKLEDGRARTVIFSNGLKPLDPAQDRYTLLASSTDIDSTLKVARHCLDRDIPTVLPQLSCSS